MLPSFGAVVLAVGVCCAWSFFEWSYDEWVDGGGGREEERED